MPANSRKKFDLEVNHELIFECLEHEVRLQGEPRLHNDSKFAGNNLAHWMLDVGDMYCPVGRNVEECDHGWVVSIDGLWVG